MKKSITIIASLIILASCAKDEGVSPSGCQQCRQVVTDSTTGDTIKINYGTPTSTMYYCDEALDQVKSQAPSYFHNSVVISGFDSVTYYTTANGENVDTLIVTAKVSTTQKYQYFCN